MARISSATGRLSLSRALSPARAAVGDSLCAPTLAADSIGAGHVRNGDGGCAVGAAAVCASATVFAGFNVAINRSITLRVCERRYFADDSELVFVAKSRFDATVFIVVVFNSILILIVTAIRVRVFIIIITATSAAFLCASTNAAAVRCALSDLVSLDTVLLARAPRREGAPFHADAAAGLRAKVRIHGSIDYLLEPCD